jgi:hypothetical protein
MKHSLKYAVLIGAVFIMLAMPTVAQAKKHEDYRPWKAAMVVWIDDWGTHHWLANVDWSLYDGPIVSVETPWGFKYWKNTWGNAARQFAQFITAVAGPMPNGQLDRPLKTILQPYLGLDPEVWPPPSLKRQVPR